jgi:hypothetical protein
LRFVVSLSLSLSLSEGDILQSQNFGCHWHNSVASAKRVGPGHGFLGDQVYSNIDEDAGCSWEQ